MIRILQKTKKANFLVLTEQLKEKIDFFRSSHLSCGESFNNKTRSNFEHLRTSEREINTLGFGLKSQIRMLKRKK